LETTKKKAAECFRGLGKSSAGFYFARRKNRFPVAGAIVMLRIIPAAEA
jgi:hypothetical protein